MSKKIEGSIKDTFKAWAAAKGYNVVRSVHVASPIGDVSLRCRSGKYTIELATELGPTQADVIAAGGTHGYAYPILNASEQRLLEFLKG